MKVNIRVIAKKADVSIATVSRVLRNYPGVREKTRKKVLKVASGLNYEINAIARNLKQEKTNTIGIIVGNVLSQFYSTIAKAVEDVAQKNGYNLILCNSDYSPEKELRYLKILKSNRVDGLILIPTGKNAAYIKNLIESGMNIVLLDRLVKGVECDSVMSDNEKGAYDAVAHLIGQGFKKIAIIDGFLYSTTGLERFNGYIRAIKEVGIQKDANLIKIGNFKKRSGIELTKELLKGPVKPDAIFVTNLDMTLGALIALKEMNIKIPDQIALVGFDDSDWANISSPPITTVSQPIYSLGVNATEMLIKKINGENIGLENKALKLTLNTELIVRQSSCKHKVIT